MRSNTDPIEIRMNDGNTVVTRDDVAESRESFLDSLYFNFIWQGIPDVLKLLIGSCVGSKKTVFVS